MKIFKKSKREYSEYDDHALVRFYKNDGDEHAFNELINRHQDKVYSYILSMVQNTEVASDIFQDTFTKVITKLGGTYNEQGKFIAWVMRIAHNSTIDYLRKNKRFVDVSSTDDDNNTNFYERLPDETMIHADEQLEFDEKKKSLFKHINNLPDEQRQVVMLRNYYEMSFKEIAEITDVSINTALGRMRYALINLRKMFEEEKIHEVNYGK